ncbi:flagellar basal-body MS-ring/collar protein FliF [Novosphingobium colocasiae]|uniref:flagellar basal-body MS-ring/collar protein FliF n=1 Tax=Novosphingobium colocasiae TaxID=1256513 RepID=UPI0035AE5286
MAELVPALPDGAIGGGGTLLAPLTARDGGPILTRLAAFVGQPAVKKTLPAFVGLSAIGAAALAWTAMAPSPQRTLYAELDDGDRATVVAALDQAGIGYHIDNQTGALTVAEGDFYKARMLVASDGALATPETGEQMLDKLPLGASRSLEGQRLRAAREQDLQLTIREIDGVEGVRVHIAEGEKSVFVRENVPPTASVMVRLVKGRSLSESQVQAIVNLVAGSVPGLLPDAVKVVDQHGRLLSQGGAAEGDRLDLQARMEAKLRDQVDALLQPVLGEGNYTSEVQVDLDMADVTSARESYDKDGVVRTESQQQSQSSGAGQAAGVPGVLSNTPPPPTTAQPGPPGAAAPAAPATPPTNGESSSSKTYELGREVSVSNSGPGGVKRLSVAVAISSAAAKGSRPQDLKDMEALVSAAVGANPARGDVVKVVVRGFEPAPEAPVPFYEAPWFAMVVRNGAALLAVLMVLLIGVRPMVSALRGEKTGNKAKRVKGAADDEAANDAEGSGLEGEQALLPPKPHIPGLDPADLDEPQISRAQLLGQQLTLAQRLVAERPDSAVQVLRQMLNQPEGADAEGAKEPVQ